MKTLRHHTGRLAFMLLMLVALAAQSVIPAGFMPGQSDDGTATIVICTNNGPQTISVSAEHNPFAQQHAENAGYDLQAPHCAYASVLAYDNTPLPSPYALPALLGVPPLAAARQAPPTANPPHSYLAQGPPFSPHA